jgi:hypothetical protein
MEGHDTWVCARVLHTCNWEPSCVRPCSFACSAAVFVCLPVCLHAYMRACL